MSEDNTVKLHDIRKRLKTIQEVLKLIPATDIPGWRMETGEEIHSIESQIGKWHDQELLIGAQIKYIHSHADQESIELEILNLQARNEDRLQELKPQIDRLVRNTLTTG